MNKLYNLIVLDIKLLYRKKNNWVSILLVSLFLIFVGSVGPVALQGNMYIYSQKEVVWLILFKVSFIISGPMIFFQISSFFHIRDELEQKLMLPISKNAILVSKLFSLFAEIVCVYLLIGLPTIIYWLSTENDNKLIYMQFKLTIVFILEAYATLITILLITCIITWFQIFLRRLRTIGNIICGLLGLFLFYQSIISRIYNEYIINPHIEFIISGSCLNKGLLCCVCFFILSILSYIGLVYLCRISAKLNMQSKWKRGCTKGFYNKKCALILKEYQQFFRRPLYLMNFGMGILLSIVSGIIVLVMKEDIYLICSNVLEINLTICKQIFPYIIVAILTLFSIRMNPASIAISMEQNNLYILKTAPIDAKIIFQSKILFNLLLNIIVQLITLICYSVGLHLPIEMLIALLWIIFSIEILISISGIFLNIYFPKMRVNNETEIVKNWSSVSNVLNRGIVCAIVCGAMIIQFYIGVNKNMLYGFSIVAGSVIIGLSLVLYCKLMNSGKTKLYEI